MTEALATSDLHHSVYSYVFQLVPEKDEVMYFRNSRQTRFRLIRFNKVSVRIVIDLVVTSNLSKYKFIDKSSVKSYQLNFKLSSSGLFRVNKVLA